MKRAKQKPLFVPILVPLILVLFLIVSVTFAWFYDAAYSALNMKASIQRSYFESGTGTASDPYEIHRPIQLYYFSWLQQMGSFNQEDPNNTGNIAQTYFYLSDDLDMQGFTIPAIGSATYPFVGNFDGQGHIVSNLYVQNNHEEFTNEPEIVNYPNHADQIIGFFGVIGSLDASSQVNGYTYSKSVNAVKDLCLDSVMITSETPKDNKTLIGIVAGYVNGDISGVAVCNSGIFVKSGLSPLGNTLYTKISDYSTVGYCQDAYKNHIQIETLSLSNILLQTGDEGGAGSGAGSSGGSEVGPGGEPIDDVPGNAWGGSINMKNLFSRLYDIYENRADGNYSYYGQETRYQYIDAPELNHVTDRSAGGVVNGGLSGTGWASGTIFESNKFKVFDQNYDEGAVTYSQSLFDDGESYLYLIGEIDENFDIQATSGETTSALINKIVTVHTLEETTSGDGLYIKNGDHYLSAVASGSSYTYGDTTRENASKWLIASGTQSALYTQIDGVNYYLTHDDKSLAITTDFADCWTISGNTVSTTFVTRTWALGQRETVTVTLKYQSNRWQLVESDDTLQITDNNGHYLSYVSNGAGGYTVTNDSNAATAKTWLWNKENQGYNLIYFTEGDVSYYLVNHNSYLTLETVESAEGKSNLTAFWTVETSNGNNIIKSTLGATTYNIEYQEGAWILRPNTQYRIHYGKNYLKYIPSTGKLDIDQNAANGTVWTFSNGASGGYISKRVGTTDYYLTNNNGTLTMTTSATTSWSVAQNNYGQNFMNEWNITSQIGSTTYYLLCENGVWSVSSASKYVIGYKYSNTGDGNMNAGYLGIDLTIRSRDSHIFLSNQFTWESNLESAPMWTYNASTGECYHLSSNGTKYFFAWYASALKTGYKSNDSPYKMTVSVSATDSKISLAYNGKTYSLRTNGTDFWGTASVYTQNGRMMRPPLSLESVSSQSVGFTTYNGSMELERNVSVTYFREVEGSPDTETQTQVSKLHATYVPINVISTTDANYTPMADGSTSYFVSQRNTGYIVSGASYQKYNNYSTYRLGDIRVANYNLDELDAEYFEAEAKTILKVLTNNAAGFNEEYDMTKASSYFNKSFPKVQEVLRSDGNMYGIHFMDAKISASRTMTAEKAVIEHVSYYDYEMPESTIDFSLMQNGYINFFAGTYANDPIVGDNDSFFSFYQVLREQTALPDSAIVAIYTCTGRPTVFKMNNGKFYYYNTTDSAVTYIKNIDDIFDTGKSLDDLYLQVTSGVYMNKNNPSGTIYYTLRNDVRDSCYYTFNYQTSALTLYASTLPSGYVSAADITAIKQIDKIYSRYTSVGASSLACKDLIYAYKDGTYSRDNVTAGDGDTVTYDHTSYSLVFDLAWIDSETELVSDAIYYFEIPVMSGEYCLGSVEGGRGAYLLYLDLSTNLSNGEEDGVTSESAIIETETTKIETYVYPKGISIVEDTSDFASVPDYETVGVALQNAGGCTISRSGDTVTVTAANGQVIYVGNGLTVAGGTLNAAPYKTTVTTNVITVIKVTEITDGVTSSTSTRYDSERSTVYTNETVTLSLSPVLQLSALQVLDEHVSPSGADAPIMEAEITFSPDDSVIVTSLDVEVVNATEKSILVTLLYIEESPAYSYTAGGSEQTVNYTIVITPSSLASTGDEVTIAAG